MLIYLDCMSILVLIKMKFNIANKLYTGGTASILSRDNTMRIACLFYNFIFYLRNIFATSHAIVTW